MTTPNQEGEPHITTTELPIEPTYVFHLDTQTFEEMSLDDIEAAYGGDDVDSE